jgi:hemerythrin-like domain-containing protein
MTAPAPRPRTDARPARPTRAPAPPLPAFEALDRTHREMLEMLAAFDGLLDHVDEHGPDATARERAGRILDFFNRHAREHHAREEAVVFPPLLAGPDDTLAAHVRRLQQDHGWLEEDWIELAPQIEAISRGYNWYDLTMLRHALPVFKALYEEHIALEESLVYPAARRHHATLAEGKQARAEPGGG